MRSFFLAVVLMMVGWAVQAATVLSIKEVGGDVVGTLSGSFDLVGADTAPNLTGSNGAFILPSILGPRISTQFFTSADSLRGYTITGPTSFGTGPATVPTSTTASILYLLGDLDRIALPSAYQSGDLLGGDMVFGGQSFSTLGLTVGSYAYSLSNGDTFTIEIGTSAAVAIPAAGSMLIAALFGLAGFGRSKKS